jgi:uncharacterized tellurite resistance protein B-like protein
MIDRLLNLLTGRETPAVGERRDEPQLSVAALLIEAARMDSIFDADERTAIARLLKEKFSLDDTAVRSLIEQAQDRIDYSAQYFPFTSEICRRLSREERIEVIEMLWKVAYSDGVIDPHEDMLLRQIAGLIHVPDRERSLARKRALAHLAGRTLSSD